MSQVICPDFESARRKYKPCKIRFLLVAEAPPKKNSCRFFYFENVKKHDALYLETMKVLCPNNTQILRNDKPKFLRKFMCNGYYLIDASDKPIINKRLKKHQIEGSIDSLTQKIYSLQSDNIKIILIKKNVYNICFKKLSEKGFNVINKSPIPFPIDHQREFKEKLKELLHEYDPNYISNFQREFDSDCNPLSNIL